MLKAINNFQRRVDLSFIEQDGDMVSLDLVINLFSSVSLVVMVAYLIGRSRYLIHCIKYPNQPKNMLLLIVIFSIVSMIGTYSGVKVHGAYANTRIVGALMSGFMGGPFVGAVVGILSGLYRYLLGGFTAHICGTATAVAGVVAGIIRYRIGFANLTWQKAGIVALLMEIMQKVSILLFAEPFERALALEKVIALPTTLVTVCGSIIFFFIVEDIKAAQEQHGAEAAKVSLQIASRTQPYLRQGLTEASAQKTAEIILELTGVDAVLIADKENILTSVGKPLKIGKDCSLSHLLKKCVDEKDLLVLPDVDGIYCGVIAPLMVKGDVAGLIYLARSKQLDMSDVDTHIAKGLAQLLAVQIQLAEIDAQRKMREKAELKALQAQINPHFLFNTLSIIMSFCRTDADMARKLIGNLATMLQRSFAKRNDLIALEDELVGIEAYLEIVKARFGNRLSVNIEIDNQYNHVQIPVLCIQPLVENAVQHGLFPKLNACELSISVHGDDYDIVIQVCDNGIGISEDKISTIFDNNSSIGIGIQNVHRRLQSLYGAGYGLRISSKLGQGTSVMLRIPTKKVS